MLNLFRSRTVKRSLFSQMSRPLTKTALVRGPKTSDKLGRQSDLAKSKLDLGSVNQHIVDASYAVRGEIVLLAEDIQRQLKNANHHYPFNKIIFCNIGNPQALKQQPILFNREVLAMVADPGLVENEYAEEMFTKDAIVRAKEYNKLMGLGAYSHSKGHRFVRDHIAKFIEDRDDSGAGSVDPKLIFMSNGASDAIAKLMNLLVTDNTQGFLLPIPQYPLYSALLTILDCRSVPYYLNEDDAWQFDITELEKSMEQAQKDGTDVRAMVVINPGNPTGQILKRKTMEDIITFCGRNGLVLLADEVYQENIYDGSHWNSFRKVLQEMSYERERVQLASFHSTSKGFFGECGMRGGYMDLMNFDPDVVDQIYKLCSISLGPNTMGQLAVDLMVNPPHLGDASYGNYLKETQDILSSLKRRADKLSRVLNSLDGMSCNQAQGAMYLFPSIEIPAKAMEEADRRGVTPDALYCTELLQQAGIVVVPGSGFGQKMDTYHFRTTFLPPEDDMDYVCDQMEAFHKSFMETYA